MSVHTCGTQIASEIGPYKMGNCFEYEAGQEKVEKIIIESKEKDAVKKNAWALQDGVSPERPHIYDGPRGAEQDLMATSRVRKVFLELSEGLYGPQWTTPTMFPRINRRTIFQFQYIFMKRR